MKPRLQFFRTSQRGSGHFCFSNRPNHGTFILPTSGRLGLVQQNINVWGAHRHFACSRSHFNLLFVHRVDVGAHSCDPTCCQELGLYNTCSLQLWSATDVFVRPGWSYGDEDAFVLRSRHAVLLFFCNIYRIVAARL